MSNNYVTFLALVSTHNIDDYDRAKKPTDFYKGLFFPAKSVFIGLSTVYYMKRY